MSPPSIGPVSNLKLGSGIANVMEMVKSGMNVALGTDGVASNNNLDLFEEIKAAALLAKGTHLDPTAVAAPAALLMQLSAVRVHRAGRPSAARSNSVWTADLILLDFTQPHLIPCHNVISHLVYATSGHDVVMTMVRGNILYSAGTYPTIDLPSVVRELTEYTMPHVFSDAGEHDSEKKG